MAKLSKEEMVRVAEMAASPGGKVFMGRMLETEFQQTVERLLYAPTEEVEVLRGKARGLHEQIKTVNDCIQFQRTQT